MGSRRRARESALQILFGMDWVQVPSDAGMDEYWSRFAGERPAHYDEVRRQCAELVEGVVRFKTALDARLQASSHHWKLERMSAVDRNILRMAAFELLYLGDKVPRKVAINEAIEIAKKFGNEDSGAFINGILDRIAQDQVRTAERPKPVRPKPAASTSVAAAVLAAHDTDEDLQAEPGEEGDGDFDAGDLVAADLDDMDLPDDGSDPNPLAGLKVASEDARAGDGSLDVKKGAV